MDVIIAIEQTIINLRYFLFGLYVVAFFAFVSGVRIPGPDRVRSLAAWVCAFVGMAFLFRVGIEGYVLYTSEQPLSVQQEADFNWTAFTIMAATGLPVAFDLLLSKRAVRDAV